MQYNLEGFSVKRKGRRSGKKTLLYAVVKMALTEEDATLIRKKRRTTNESSGKLEIDLKESRGEHRLDKQTRKDLTCIR